MQNFDIAGLMMTLTALILGVTFHEWAHAIVADRMGDDTPRRQGRVTLWPLAHLDPLGTICMVVSSITGFGFGWGRPVMTDPRNYRINPRIAGSLVTIAGPLSNLVLAALFAGVLRLHLFPPTDAFTFWVDRIVEINVILFLFNLLPIYPLDGSRLLANVLPPGMGDGYLRFMQQFGYLIFIALVMSKALYPILGPAVGAVYNFLVGSAGVY